jgi:hypothetical protein
MDPKKQFCSNCRFFCQDADSESRLYYDEKSGECRRQPPHANFSWVRTRPHHWCGEWQPRALGPATVWQRLSAHPKDDRPVLLYKHGAFCRQSGMIVAYWNSAFGKWHDDGDRLFEYNEFVAWMELPKPPSSQ